MRKAPIELQDLRRRIYVKAKAEPEWRFWGLFVHVCKLETLREAYALAKRNDGSPGIDGVTFEAIEAGGVERFIGQIREELVTGEYLPLRNRRQEIPKDGGKVRVLGIPAIRDRVVQGALKLIVEPIFEADFQAGSYGYRPRRSAHAAVKRVAEAIVSNKTRVIDVDLSSYFDNQASPVAGKGGTQGERPRRAGVAQEDSESEREERGAAGRGNFTLAEQRVPERGRPDAGTGQRNDP